MCANVPVIGLTVLDSQRNKKGQRANDGDPECGLRNDDYQEFHLRNECDINGRLDSFEEV